MATGVEQLRGAARMDVKMGALAVPATKLMLGILAPMRLWRG